MKNPYPRHTPDASPVRYPVHVYLYMGTDIASQSCLTLLPEYDLDIQYPAKTLNIPI